MSGLRSPGRASGRSRSASPNPAWTWTGSGSPVASFASSPASRAARPAAPAARRPVRRGRRRSSSAPRSPPRGRPPPRRRRPPAATRTRSAGRDAPAAGQRSELLPARADPRRRIARVDEHPLRVRRAQERRGVGLGVRREPPRVDGLLGRLAAEVLRQHADRAPVRHRGGDVRPLAGVAALREQAAELVEPARRRAQDAVRVLVDERDGAQYFSK